MFTFKNSKELSKPSQFQKNLAAIQMSYIWPLPAQTYASYILNGHYMAEQNKEEEET